VRRAPLGLALSGLLAITGCVSQQAGAPAPVLPAYEQFKNLGPMDVAGEDPGDPGPRVFDSVNAVPRLRAFLSAQGTPDSLEVLEPSGGNLRIELNYASRDRRIVVERVDGRLTAYAPTHLDGSPLGSASSPAPSSARPSASEPAQAEQQAAGETPSPSQEQEAPVPEEVPMATELQSLECPIDPLRADCARLCVPGAPYEWCQ
jgi:hypothetical protein